MICPHCGNAELQEVERDDEFQLGHKNPVTLKATGPVLTCHACGYAMSDWRMERARNLAVSAYFHGKEQPNIPEPYLTTHAFSSLHQKQLEHAGKAGCFYCLEIYPVAEIEEWIDGEQTALCPKCGIDAVLPVTEEVTPEFLKAMQQEWFAVAKNL